MPHRIFNRTCDGRPGPGSADSGRALCRVLGRLPGSVNLLRKTTRFLIGTCLPLAVLATSLSGCELLQSGALNSSQPYLSYYPAPPPIMCESWAADAGRPCHAQTIIYDSRAGGFYYGCGSPTWFALQASSCGGALSEQEQSQYLAWLAVAHPERSVPGVSDPVFNNNLATEPLGTSTIVVDTGLD